MSSKETDFIRDLLFKTEPEVIKYLFNLDQSFNVEELEHALHGRKIELRFFIKVFPELMNLYDTLQERSDYLKQNSSAFINWLNYHKKDQALKDFDKSIKEAHQKLRKRIKQAKSIAHGMGLELFDQGTPNYTSSHYKAACQAAQMLCAKWFIGKVYVFGSVSRGKERPDSDIDLALSRVSKRNPSPIEILIKQCLKPVHEEYHPLIPKALCERTNTMFDIVNYSKKLIQSGHLKDAILIADNDMFEIKVDNQSFTFKKTSLLKEYTYVKSTYSTIMQSLVYPFDGDKYQNVIIKDDLPLLYRIIRFQVDEDGYIKPQTLDFNCIKNYNTKFALADANDLVYKALQPMQPKQTYWTDYDDVE